MDRDLLGRVVRTGALGVVPVAAAALYLADVPGLLGVLAGGGVALASLLLLSMGCRQALALWRDGRVHPLWLLSLGLRHLSLFAVLGILLWSGYVHPLGLVAGVSLLPPILISQALRD
jgi:hypothetical protein